MLGLERRYAISMRIAGLDPNARIPVRSAWFESGRATQNRVTALLILLRFEDQAISLCEQFPHRD